MKCIVTAGPTYEPLDEVRRLTNFSTGRLGSELVNFLSARGHEVTLLIGQQATWRGERLAKTVETFTTTADLKERVAKLASPEIGAVFHAAAVNDFGFGKVFQRSADRELKEIKADKIPTRMDSLLVELVATPKIIGHLRNYFPNAKIVGWKYEMDGTRAEVITKALAQIRENKTDACVANGAAYGAGFGIVKSADESAHYLGPAELFEGLSKLLQK